MHVFPDTTWGENRNRAENRSRQRWIFGNEYIASFCGFGPTEDPRAICLVVLDNPRGVYYGGQVAAPVFKETMGQIMRYMGIPAMEEKG